MADRFQIDRAATPTGARTQRGGAPGVVRLSSDAGRSMVRSECMAGLARGALHRGWTMFVVTAADPHERPSGDLIKIWFRFVPREGWLPYDTEGLWATRVGEDTARVENVAFLQDGIAHGDVVRFRTNEDGSLWATGRVEASGHCVIRVLPVPSGPLGRSASAVHAAFARFGLDGEVFSAELPFVAFDVPADADLGEIHGVLADGESQGWWHFEVGCGTDRWWNSAGIGH